MASDAGRVILVEGMEDLHTIAGFFNRMRLTKFEGRDKQWLALTWLSNGAKLDIVSSGGIDKAKNFHQTLEDLDALQDCHAIALVVDADSDSASRWNSVRDRLEQKGFEVPVEPTPAGTIVQSAEAHPPKVGVWMMPDNRQAGMLETFLGMCVPGLESNPVWNAAVAQTLVIAGAVGEESRFKDVHLDKAKIHSYLAWTEPPGLPLGQAVLKGLLDSESDHARRFLQWIHRVFEFEGPAD